MFGAWVSPCCLEHILLVEQGVVDDELMLRTELQKQVAIVIAVAIPFLPKTPFHSSKSRPTLALKSPKIRSLSLESTCYRRLCRSR